MGRRMHDVVFIGFDSESKLMTDGPVDLRRAFLALLRNSFTITPMSVVGLPKYFTTCYEFWPPRSL